MAPPIRELLSLDSKVAASVDDANGVVVVKGFASVERPDRSKDLVPPQEFNIDQFMAAPVLLVNHKPWVDDRGNGVAAGHVSSLHAAEIVDVGKDAFWGIQDLKTGEVINDFPKDKVPNLSSGDRGLFVTARVTQEEVAKKVREGEFGTFSWRGLVAVDYVHDPETSMPRRVLRDIDLWELSVTHIADNPNSTFVIGKSAAEEDVVDDRHLAVHLVKLDKTRFETKKMACEYLQAHGLYDNAVREDDYSFYSLQQEGHEFDLTKLHSVKMVEGVSIIAGPMVEKAALSSAAVNDLPDSAFAIILPDGEKDDEGKTKPRSLRKFPIHDAAHVRNALARLNQASLSPEQKRSIFRKVLSAANKFGVSVSDDVKSKFGTQKTPGGVLMEILTSSEVQKLSKLYAVTQETSKMADEQKSVSTTEKVDTKPDENKITEEVSKAGDCPDGMVWSKDHNKCVSADEVQKSTSDSPEAQALSALGTDIATKTAEKMAETFKPVFEGLTKNLELVGSGMTQLIQKSASEVDTEKENKTEVVEKKDDVSKSLGGVVDALNKMAEVAVAQQKQMDESQREIVEVAKTVEALAKATPDQTVRDESLETEKKNDPNSVFNSTFGFLGS